MVVFGVLVVFVMLMMFVGRHDAGKSFRRRREINKSTGQDREHQ